jgi:hypothetical protein
VNWLLKRTTIGTSADTPASLRRKAAEFIRLAVAAADPSVVEELEILAWRYLERAEQLEAPVAASSQSSADAERSPI